MIKMVLCGPGGELFTRTASTDERQMEGHFSRSGGAQLELGGGSSGN